MSKSEFAALIKSTIAEAIRENKIQIQSFFPEAKDNEYCRIDKVAAHFGVTKATIHNWAKRGTIRKYKISGRTLYKLAEIEKAFSEN